MGKFKVKTDKKTYNQVRSLLLESGFRISAPTGVDWVIGELGGIISSYSDWRDGPPEWLYTIKELTLPELRDMVVLKRNDVNDATHESGFFKYVELTDGWYYYDLGCTDKWQKSSGAKPEYYEKLKPIEKNMNTLNTEHHEQPSLKDQYLEQAKKINDACASVFKKQDDLLNTMLEHSSASINDQFAEIEQVRQASKDNVSNPSHYTQGKVECIDALESATIGKSGIEAVCVANVIKYLWRYEEKNGVEDVKKAQWYLERLIASMDS